ncbi:MAG: hypothetical protein J6C15_02415, partial [Bacteroidaceae bacterium]|nr:hypothetical protein [Bacteroidaceae bacterium]
QQPVSIYAKKSTVGLEQSLTVVPAVSLAIYSIDGRWVGNASTWSEALKKLPRGMYIVGGKKILIR